MASRCRLLLRSEERRGSEEHTSELQSPWQLVCRLLLEENDGGPGPLPQPLRQRQSGRCVADRAGNRRPDFLQRGDDVVQFSSKTRAPGGCPLAPPAPFSI